MDRKIVDRPEYIDDVRVVNDYEDIESAFSVYYTTTLLSNSVTPSSIYDIEAKDFIKEV